MWGFYPVFYVVNSVLEVPTLILSLSLLNDDFSSEDLLDSLYCTLVEAKLDNASI